MEEKKYLKWYNKVGYGTGDLPKNVTFLRGILKTEVFRNFFPN